MKNLSKDFNNPDIPDLYLNKEPESGTQYQPITLEDPANYQPCLFPTILQSLAQTKDCQVLICITIYNENSFDLQATLQGVLKNIENLTQDRVCPGKFCITLIQDGLEKLHPNMTEYGESMNLFFLRNIEDSDPNTLHLYATEFTLAKNNHESYPTVTLVTGVKQSNKGKINSHRWFFKCICHYINPKYCVLMDCGTIPNDYSIYKLIEEMQINPQVGGACGNILPEDPKVCHLLEISQDIEYRVSHFMDKCLESLFGFVTVLPGAFCGYRWEAINGDPLDEYYFYSYREDAVVNCWRANMFLAEDQLLGTATVLRKDKNYLLSYLSDAKVSTDVPSTYQSIMQQRRRWINGARFAYFQTLVMFANLQKTNHSFCRKFFLTVFFLYQSFNLLIGTFAPAVFFMYIYTISKTRFGGDWEVLTWVTSGTYIGCLVTLLGISLVPRAVHKFRNIYILCAGLLGVLTLAALFLIIYELFQRRITFEVSFYLGVMFLGLFLCAALHGQLKAYLRGMFQYLYMLPSFLNMYMIYAFCNVHDVTWGIRNDKCGNF